MAERHQWVENRTDERLDHPYYYSLDLGVVVSQRQPSKAWGEAWWVWRSGICLGGPFKTLEAAKLAAYLIAQ
jgi:hypothetical protein